jgi:hypothetical protein
MICKTPCAKKRVNSTADPITARFLTSQVVMTTGTLVVIVAWILDGVVSGSPKLLRIYTDDAMRLADVRDKAWTGIDDNHRVVHPVMSDEVPRSLMKTQVRAEQRKNDQWEAESDNFGKIHRLYDEQITAFEDSVLDLRAAGKTLKEWHAFIKRGERTP